MNQRLLADGPVRILHLEDDPLDGELVREILTAAIDAEVQRVDTREGFMKALSAGGVDAIVSDYALPGFLGTEAAVIARERAPDVPFVFVSGTLGEEAAVDALKLGAADYVLKDRLARLPTAVMKALEQAWERRRLRVAESRLHESEERFRRFMDASPAGAFMKDLEGRIVYVNRAVERVLGRPAAQIVGRTDFDLFPREIADAIRATDLEVARRGEGMEVEQVIVGPDGEKHHWSMFKFPFSDVSGHPLVAAIAVDITERKRLEERYLHAQKLEAVGRLASGVAHDFNNLLTVILGCSQLIRDARRDDLVIQPQLNEIRDAVQRASSLTRQLLAFSRQEVIEPVLVDVNDVIESMGRMARRIIGEDVRFHVRLAQRVGCVRIDPGQLEQVLMNLIVNARDATAAGGTITVRTGEASWDQVSRSADPDVKPGPYVLVAVEDTGAGMTPEVQARLFEPFFTTKEPGKGTGLGLATVHGIVKQNGGWISVRSAPGAGTEFEVYLPRTEGAPARARQDAEAEAPRGGDETIVVAEDNKDVRSLVGRILTNAGYRVVLTEDGVEALKQIHETQGKVHLLVTDVVMPRMNGPDLADVVRSIRPELPVLFLSGYADNAAAARIATEPGTVLVKKPFAARDLLRNVRDLIDGVPKV